MQDDPFIDQAELLDAREYVTQYIKKNMNWREGFMHRRIYNEVNHRLGVLRKVEITRQKVTIESQKELIKLLWILGYPEKQIAYLLWEWGYKGFTIDQIRTNINKQKIHWRKEKEDFMNEIVETKNAIFQVMRQTVMESEKSSILIYLDKIKILQDELVELCPIKDRAKVSATVNMIEKLNNLVKGAHGIDEMRTASIKVETEIAIAKGKSPDKKEEELIPQGTLI